MKVANYLYELTQKLKSDKYYIKHMKLENTVKEIQDKLLFTENQSVIYPSTDYSYEIEKYKEELQKAKDELQKFLDSEIKAKETKANKKEENKEN